MGNPQEITIDITEGIQQAIKTPEFSGYQFVTPVTTSINYIFCTPGERYFADELHQGHRQVAEF
jgi:hypothetical protein